MLTSSVLDLGRRYVPSPHVTWAPRSSYFIIGNGERLSVANGSLVDLLARMDGQCSLARIMEGIARDHIVSLPEVNALVLPVAQTLLESGIIVPSGEANEPVISGRSEQPHSNAAKFSHLFLEMTARCNLRCKHCYMEAGLARPNEVALHDMIRLVDEFTEIGGSFVTLSGGEPLLYRGWPILARHAADSGLRLSMMTNGTYLDEPTFAIVKDFDIGIGLGVDGMRAETHDLNRGKGSFAETMAALDLLSRRGYQRNTTICFSALRFNVYDLPGVAEMMLARGLPRLYVSLMEDRGRAATFRDRLELTSDQRVWLLRFLYQLARQHGDRLNVEVTHHVPIYQRLLLGDVGGVEPDRSLTIRMESEGELFLSAYMGSPELMVGRVGEKPLKALLESDLASEILNSCTGREQRIEKCKQCVYKNLCRGGSPVLAYSKFGSFEEVDDFCEARIALFDWLTAEKAVALTAGEPANWN